MEHREPPRIVTAEDPSPDLENDPVRGRRFARFVTPPSVRRLSRVRIVLALGLAGVLIYLLSLAGMVGLRSLRSFVHEQPEYQLNFNEIELDPPPPAWYRGGAKQFLEQVREEAGQPARFSVLDLDLTKLRLAFKRSSWVRKASVTRANPNRVIIQLEYREPVARADIDPKGTKFCLIDRDAVILNQAEVNLENVVTLRLTKGRPAENVPPFDARFGESWKTPSGPNGLPEIDERIQAGAKLADWLRKEVARDRAGQPWLVPTVVVQSAQRLWLQFGTSVLIAWGPPPTGEEPPAESVATKWKILRNSGSLPDWVEHDTESTPSRYFEFRDGKLGIHRW
jgi:hypothetical protein